MSYGSQDALFTIPGSPKGYKYYVLVDPVTKIGEVKRRLSSPILGGDFLVGFYDTKTGKYKSSNPAFDSEVNPNNKNAITYIGTQVYEATWKGIFKNGDGKITTTQAQAQAQNLLNSNKGKPDQKPPAGTDGKNNPTSPPGGSTNTSTFTEENNKTLEKEVAKDVVEKTKKGNFGDWYYPKTLRSEIGNRDCIQFSILEYTARKLNLSIENQNIRRSGAFQTNPVGHITLPIPAGISDRNSVDWQRDDISSIQEGAGAILSSFFTQGTDAAGKAAEEQIKAAVGGNPDLLKAIVAAKTTQELIGSQNIMARQYGAILNPNMELLFNSPSLRDFSFQFRMTPRDKEEAAIVRTIIRVFKQAMAPKRSTSVLLLKTPFIFNIQYLANNKDHPYLNKFKQCALINCSVNYTPDGSYSVYDDSSMTCYELNLGFQELQPIYNDDYGDDFGPDNPAQNVGY